MLWICRLQNIHLAVLYRKSCLWRHIFLSFSFLACLTQLICGCRWQSNLTHLWNNDQGGKSHVSSWIFFLSFYPPKVSFFDNWTSARGVRIPRLIAWFSFIYVKLRANITTGLKGVCGILVQWCSLEKAAALWVIVPCSVTHVCQNYWVAEFLLLCSDDGVAFCS